jgi:hypothetical protein
VRRTTPDAFFWLLAGALAIAIAAAALAPDRAPALALYWNPIYRAEVALVVLALVYLLGTAGRMAWHGQAFRRIELPGGAALERDTAELDAATTEIDSYREYMTERVDALAESLDEVIDRVDELAGGSDPPDPRVPRSLWQAPPSMTPSPPLGPTWRDRGRCVRRRSTTGRPSSSTCAATRSSSAKPRAAAGSALVQLDAHRGGQAAPERVQLLAEADRERAAERLAVDDLERVAEPDAALVEVAEHLRV